MPISDGLSRGAISHENILFGAAALSVSVRENLLDWGVGRNFVETVVDCVIEHHDELPCVVSAGCDDESTCWEDFFAGDSGGRSNSSADPGQCQI